MARAATTTKAKAGRKAAPASKAKKSAKPSLAPKSYVGRRVAKDFDGEVYHGTVSKYKARAKLWAIKYDDGDAEEMDWNDLARAMELHGGNGEEEEKKEEEETEEGKMTPPKDVAPETAPSSSAAAVAQAVSSSPAQSAETVPDGKYRVVKRTYPRNGSAEDGEEDVIGDYPTREQANDAARAAMANADHFEGWGEAQYEGRDPPYSSAEGPFEAIADEDEFMDIVVVDLVEEEAREKSEPGEARESKPAGQATEEGAKDEETDEETADDEPRRKFGPTEREIVVDADLFRRNPCRVPGGVSRPPEAYPNHRRGNSSFGFLIQRLSDRNYAMRALCLEGRGAEYNTYNKPDVSYISVVWYPPSNLNDHANDASIVDGCHLDLIDPDCGTTYLTGRNINRAIEDAGRPVRCLFLNGAQSNPGSSLSADDIASAVSRCRESLLCVSLTECRINSRLLAAVASCGRLRGLIIENCQLERGGDDVPGDADLAAVLDSCPDLRWLFVKSSIFADGCWDVLATEGACPNLEVLWVDAPMQTKERIDVARGNHDTIRRAVDSRGGRLKLCVINPDDRCRSRYAAGGTTDELNGAERAVGGRVGRGGGNSYLNTV